MRRKSTKHRYFVAYESMTSNTELGIILQNTCRPIRNTQFLPNNTSVQIGKYEPYINLRIEIYDSFEYDDWFQPFSTCKN